jgi:hypothetical protein
MIESVYLAHIAILVLILVALLIKEPMAIGRVPA